MSNFPSLIALIMAAAGAGAALSPAPVANYGTGTVRTASGNIATATGSAGRLVIERADDGFFYMPATINGSSVRFLIDTGASMVILPRPVADEAGITGTSRATATTVGGPQSVDLASIRSLKAAGITLRDVPVAIQHSGMSIPLLGMDTLADIGRIEIDGNLLTVHPASAPSGQPSRN
jgi:aspartyl protease family protein